MYACPKHVRIDHPVLVYKTCEIERTVLRLFSCLPPALSLPAYTLHLQSSTLPTSVYSSVTSTSNMLSLLRYYYNSSESRYPSCMPFPVVKQLTTMICFTFYSIMCSWIKHAWFYYVLPFPFPSNSCMDISSLYNRALLPEMHRN